MGTQSVLENQPLEFTVTAMDPDGNEITYSTGPLPAGASFDPDARLFSWTSDSTQTGTYTVVFHATDNGTPAMTGQLEVLITVGEDLTPCEWVDNIIQTVIGLNLKKSVENSYMANLKKVCRFVQDGKIVKAIIQLEVFILKVIIDIAQDDIGREEGIELINMAVDLIRLLRA